MKRNCSCWNVHHFLFLQQSLEHLRFAQIERKWVLVTGKSVPVPYQPVAKTYPAALSGVESRESPPVRRRLVLLEPLRPGLKAAAAAGTVRGKTVSILRTALISVSGIRAALRGLLRTLLLLADKSDCLFFASGWLPRPGLASGWPPDFASTGRRLAEGALRIISPSAVREVRVSLYGPTQMSRSLLHSAIITMLRPTELPTFPVWVQFDKGYKYRALKQCDFTPMIWRGKRFSIYVVHESRMVGLDTKCGFRYNCLKTWDVEKSISKLTIKGQCHEMDLFLRSKHLISTFCVCDDGFQGLLKLFNTRYNY